MWVQRVIGVLLALAGLALFCVLAYLYNAPFPADQPLVNMIGLPGVAVGHMFAFLVMLFGLCLALAPVKIDHRARRMHWRKP